MLTIEELRAQAQADLCRRPDGRPIDPVVWEHTDRVARLTQMIAAAPELANHVIDRTALTAAAWYHDMGWLLQLQAGEIREIDLLLHRTSDRQRDRSADWMSERLRDLMPPGTIQQAVRIVRTCHQWNPSFLEARILGEADNLDQIGPQAIWMMVRKQIAEGRTLVDFIQTWRRQEQYGYWPAWIKECSQFPSVRAQAEQRYQAMRRFMVDLEAACGPESSPTAPQIAGRLPRQYAKGLETTGVDPSAAG